MPRPSQPRPRILYFPEDAKFVPALLGTRKVTAWKAPADFEFHCPDAPGGGHGGTVRGFAGMWVVHEDGACWAVEEADVKVVT